MPETVDHRADIYATGVVFYEMLAGELPEADSPPPSQRAATDARLDPIVLRAMERERERRYQAARELALRDHGRRPHSGIDDPPRTTNQRSGRTGVRRVDRAPQRMTDWYAPTDDFGPTQAEVDLQVGGRYRVAMFPPGQEQPAVVTGQYCRIDPTDR